MSPEGTHHQALQGRQAHRGVLAAPAAHRRRRGAVAQVQHDEIDLGGVLAQQLGGLAGDVGVRGAVEAVAAHTVRVGRLDVDGVAGRVLGHRRVEGGVEDGDLRQIGPQPLRGADAGDVGRVVQRRHRDQPFDLLEHRVVHQRRHRQLQPAVHHPVPDHGQLGGVQPHPVGGQLLGDRLQRRVVVGQPAVPLPLPAAAGQRLVVEGGGLLTDPLGEADGQPRTVGHVDELVLHRRGAGVEDEDTGGGHEEERSFRTGTSWGRGDQAPPGAVSPCAWTAVIATVFTMSWTKAPRLRSLTGLRRPWSTGPTATAPAERCTAL